MIITGRKIMEDTNRMDVKCRSCKKKFQISIEDLIQDEDSKNYYKFSCPECEAVNRKALGSLKTSMQDAILNPHYIPLEELYTKEKPEEKLEYERDNEGRYVPIKKYDPYHMETKCRICGRKLKISAEDLIQDPEDENYYIFHCKCCGAQNKKHFTMLIQAVQERLIQSIDEETEKEGLIEEE